MQKFFIGPNLMRAYQKKGIGQIDLTGLTKISQSQISRICSNIQPASIDQIEVFARMLEISAEELIGPNAMIFNIETQNGGNSGQGYTVNQQSLETITAQKDHIFTLQTQLVEVKAENLELRQKIEFLESGTKKGK